MTEKSKEKKQKPVPTEPRDCKRHKVEIKKGGSQVVKEGVKDGNN